MPENLTIQEAAKALDISPRQVRRWVRDGKLQAELTDGKYGPTYVITSLPPAIPGRRSHSKPLDTTSEAAMAMVKDLQRQNLVLAAELGAARAKIAELEGKLLMAPTRERPWWKRLLHFS